jgi:signal transduction histidine kinase
MGKSTFAILFFWLLPFLVLGYTDSAINPKDSISKYLKIANDKKQELIVRQIAINKAYQLNTSNAKDSNFLKIIYIKAKLHYSNEEYDSLNLFTSNLLEYSKKLENSYYLGKGFYLKAYYLDAIAHIPDSAFFYYKESKNNFLRIQDSSEIGKKLLNMAYIQQDCSDFFGSKETVTEALQFLSQKRDLKYVASAYNVLAINNRKLLNIKDAIKYYIKAKVLTKSPIDKLSFQNNLATAYIDNEEYETAIKTLTQLLQDSLLSNLPIQKARVIDNLAYVQWLKDSLDVENKLLEALNIREVHKDRSGLIASYTHLGEFYSKRNQAKAINSLNKAIIISKSIKNPKGELDALRFLISIIPNDIQIKNRYINLGDSLKKQELTVKTQFAKIRYDDRLKVNEIENLKNIMTRQQLELGLQKTQKVIYLLSGIILFILILFIISFWKQKIRIESEKEIYNTEKRISKKIHDELANDISVLANFIENSKQELTSSKTRFLENKLQNLYLRARDISNETSTIDLINFSDELRNLILQYNSKDVNVITNLPDLKWTNTSGYKKIAIYRVIQELLINTKKYSNCSKITLIGKDYKKIRTIIYNDNGIGVDKNKINTNGLTNAENRIENVKGTFNFETSIGKGFKAIIKLPI